MHALQLSMRCQTCTIGGRHCSLYRTVADPIGEGLSLGAARHSSAILFSVVIRCYSVTTGSHAPIKPRWRRSHLPIAASTTTVLPFATLEPAPNHRADWKVQILDRRGGDPLPAAAGRPLRSFARHWMILARTGWLCRRRSGGLWRILARTG